MSYLMNLIGIRKNRFTLLNECKFDLSNKIIDINGNRGVINVKIKDNLYKDKIISLFCVHFPWKPIYEYQKARILLMIFEFTPALWQCALHTRDSSSGKYHNPY